jgi:hypothetical protein
MIGRRLRRAAGTFWAAVAAVLLLAVAVPSTASAAGTRTITGRTQCNFNLPYGFSYSYASPSGTDWTGWLTSGISVIAIDTVSKTWSATIPATAGLFALDTHCYVDQVEFNGPFSYPYGTYVGFTAGLTPGTSTVTSTWSCYRGYPQFYYPPGGIVRTCAMTSASYG